MNTSLLLCSLFISFIIANNIGKERLIGFWWSLFFCVFLSPVVGLIITVLSGSKKDYYNGISAKNVDFYKYIFEGASIIGLLIGAFCIIFDVKDMIRYANSENYYLYLVSIINDIGYIGLFIFYTYLKKFIIKTKDNYETI